MEEIHGPYYSIEEAHEILSMRPSELGHAIRTQAITPVVYTKNRRMLIFSHRNWLNWGHASCMYKGHLKLPASHIAMLFDGDPIRLNEDYCTLLDPEGLQNYSTSYPFKRLTPRDWLHDWHPIELDRLALDAARATPLPDEGRSIIDLVSHFTKLTKKTGKDGTPLDTQALLKEDLNRLVFNFKANSIFEPQDLRIPASEIKKYRQQLAGTSANPLIENIPKSNETTASKSRTNQLHTLIKNILKAHPKVTAKVAWKLISDDAKNDEPLFDTEGILQLVDHQCIEWKSRHGKTQVMTWASFEPLLSKLKSQSKIKEDWSPENN